MDDKDKGEIAAYQARMEFIHEIDKCGGTAFPTTISADDGFIVTNHGMTLRDYFAGQALAGLASLPMMPRDYLRGGVLYDEEMRKYREYLQHVCREVYTLADAMLAERAKK